MKTKCLDNEIQLLNSIKRNNEISDYGQEKLNEFIAIKKQLTLTDVSQQRELLKSFCKYIDLESKAHPDDIEIDIESHLNIFNCG